MDRYADFGTRIWVRVRNYPIRQLGNRCCPRVHSCSCSCWFRPSGVVQSVCGNVSCCSRGASTGGLGYPRVTHVRSARHPLWQPILDSVSRSTDLLPGVLDGSRFNGARLWNRSVFVFSGFVQAEQYLNAGRDHLRKWVSVRYRPFRRRPDCRW